MVTPDEISQPYGPRQFSLAGLLSFFVACGIYFGLLAITMHILGEPLDNTFPWRLIATIVISWGGLLTLYRYWGLKAAMAAHFVGPVVCGILAVVAFVFSFPAFPIKESAQVFLVVLLYGPFISVFFGFPVVVVVMLIYLGLKRDMTTGHNSNVGT